MFVGFLKMRRRVINLSSTQASPTQLVYHKTTGTKQDGSEWLHALLNGTALRSSHSCMTTLKQAQNKVLSDHDDSVLLTPKK
ncbi:hypothetical protein E2C01_101606 [Portunus trituberculatus]|uniref:Uncharacterized protein n=1 Tax=Portunus trituberculatus TaxID=210409 RepID=A0A5B7KGH2_PORTR|nr:hypothetical protein [Portunus trituberculatus]